MTDPSDALASFQTALLNGNVRLQKGNLDKEIFVHLDHPNGSTRFTYVSLERKTVTALVMLVAVEPIDGIPCFQIGYAVPTIYRRQGRAKKAVLSAIAELRDGLSRAGLHTMYVEAVVDKNNEASKRIARATLSDSPTDVTDSVSGLPALQYVRKLDA